MTLRRLGAFLACALLATGFGIAQDAVDAKAFTVTSVRKSPPEFTPPQQINQADGIRYVRMSMGLLLLKAYGIQLYQLKGPSWLSSEFYDISARAPDGASVADIPQMLQQLLVDRFHLSTHWEEQKYDGYTLTTNGQLRLKACEITECPRDFFVGSPGSGVIVISANTVAGLGTRLSNILHLPVRDISGITGTFDIQLPLADPNAAAPPGEVRPDSTVKNGDRVINFPGTAPSPEDAVKDLGLRLTREKTSTKLLIVDSIDKIPTEN